MKQFLYSFGLKRGHLILWFWHYDGPDFGSGFDYRFGRNKLFGLKIHDDLMFSIGFYYGYQFRLISLHRSQFES